MPALVGQETWCKDMTVAMVTSETVSFLSVEFKKQTNIVFMMVMQYEYVGALLPR